MADNNKNEPTLLEQLEERRAKLVDKWSEYITARETERVAFEARLGSADNKPSEDEINAYRSAEDTFQAGSERREAELTELDERIRVQRNIADRRGKAAKTARKTDLAARVKSEPLTYRQDNNMPKHGGHSYFADMLAVEGPKDAAAGLQLTDVGEARDRLTRHAKEMEVEMPRRREERERRAQKQLEDAEYEFRRSVGATGRRGLDFEPFEKRVTPGRTQGQGGYFVPPLWLQEYIPGLRAGRVAAGLARQMDLPPGTDSINVPKLSTLTQVGIQGADNSPVASVDFSDTFVQANVKTLAGQEDIAIQLLEQSPYSIDDVLLTDLTADYNKRLDLQVVAGTGQNTTALNGGQVQGLYSSAGASGWTGYNTVTYTDGSPAAWKFLSVAGAMFSNVATNRFLVNPSYAMVVHPRRAMWFASGTDSNNRPLTEPRSFPSFNVDGVEADAVPAEGLVMQLPWGTPLYMDANVPVTDTAGGGSAQDVAVGALFDDVWLFEAEMRTRVLPEVLSGTLAVRFQVYNYVAMLVRYGQSIAIASGSGFAAPTGAVPGLNF